MTVPVTPETRALTSQTIEIAMGVTQLPTGKLTFTHKREVDAEVYGALAVHPTPSVKRDWSVTHVATGMGIRGGLTKASARKLAKRLQGLAWEKVNAKRGIKGWKDADAAKAIIAEFIR